MMKPHCDPLLSGHRVPATLYVEARALFDTLRFEEAIERLSEGLRNAAPVGGLEDTVQVSDCWLLLAQCHYWAGDFSAAKKAALCLDSVEESKPDSWKILFLRCMIALVDGHYCTAHETLSDWLTQHLAANDLNVDEPLLFRGYALLRMGRLDEAREDFETGYALARLKGSHRIQVELANFLGIVYHIKSRYRRAIEWYDLSRSIGSRFDSLTRMGRPTLNIGICHYRLGDYTGALAQLLDALEMLQRAGDRVNQCRAHIALANVHRLVRDFENARRHLATAHGMADELDCMRERCLALEFLGDVHRDEDRFEQARLHYKRAMTIAMELAPDGDLVSELLRREGECLVREGQAGAGLEVLARGLRQSRKLGDRFEEGVVLRCLAEGFLQTGDHCRALSYAEKAISLLDKIEARHEHAVARLTAGEILLRMSGASKDQEPRDLLDRAWDHSIIAQGIILKLDIDVWTDTVKGLQSRIMKRRQSELAFQIKPAAAEIAPNVRSRGRASLSPTVVIAESRAMKEVLQAVGAYAPYDETVLLTGETGTGKELIAQMVHQQSGRSARPMVTVNVSAIAPSMFERELFGHVKGSFSGAEADGQGFAAAADGGTLFLDEIGELPLELQVKLLRLLQNGCYHRLGDPTEKFADLRIIAATNRDLKKAVESGHFREDLFYRLADLTIHLPPLRDRTEDILPLLGHYLSVSEKRAVTVDQYFNELSCRLLIRHGWPGNVRELIQLARKAGVCKQRNGDVDLVLGDGQDAIVLSGPGPMVAAAAAGHCQDKQSLSRAHLLLALEECGGNRTDAARLLGVSRSAVYRRLKKLGLT